MSADVEFRNGLLRLHSVAGDHLGFSYAVPLSRRRKEKGATFWEASTADAPAVVSWADSKGLRVEEPVRAYSTALWKAESRNVAAATAMRLGAKQAPVVRGLKAELLDTQAVLVAASKDAWFSPPGQDTLRHRAILLADDQGLGKTLTALSVLRFEGHETERAVVVCPTSLTENWRTEADQFFAEGTFTSWTATGKTPTDIPEDADLVVIGWDILADWEETLIAWNPQAIIADEGHYAKSGKQQTRKSTAPKRDAAGNVIYRNGKAIMAPVMVEKKGPNGKPILDDSGKPVMEQEIKVVSGSARASAILNIGKAVSKNHGVIMPMTGTPIVNRPLEMVALIEFCGVEKLFVSSTQFKDRFCGPTWVTTKGGKQAKEYKGATHLLELNTRLLTSGVYYRRTKKILVDQGLLEKKYVDKAYIYDYAATPTPWTIQLTPEQRIEYEAIKDQTTDFFRTRAEEIAAARRTGVHTKLVQQKVAAEGAKHLKVLTELRQAVAKLKVPHVIEQAQKLIDSGEKLVIVAHHRDIVSAYAEAFGGLRIQGEMGTKAIEKAKALFNGTPVEENPVLVLSVEAGKTGHTLCKQSLEGVGPACARMIFAEQIWTPGDEAQAQDRIWRIGQDREVFISNALAHDTIDQMIYKQRAAKRWVFNAAIDSIDRDSLDAARSEKSGAGELAQRLVYGQAA